MALAKTTAPVGTPVIFRPAFKHPYSNESGVINKQLDYTHPMQVEVLLTSGKHVNVDYCELELDTEYIDEHEKRVGFYEKRDMYDPITND